MHAGFMTLCMITMNTGKKILVYYYIHAPNHFEYYHSLVCNNNVLQICAAVVGGAWVTPNIAVAVTTLEQHA